jgi:phosphomannomutase
LPGKIQYPAMAANPIHFGTSGWRGIIADDFTFPDVRRCVEAIAAHALAKRRRPTLIVGYDRRFFSEEFAQTAAEVLRARGVRVLFCAAAAPTPAIAWEIIRRKADGGINFTASHNPGEYNGLKFSGPDGAPALPEVTREIEERAARLAARESRPKPHEFSPVAGQPGLERGEPAGTVGGEGIETIDPSAAYLARLEKFVRFDRIREAGIGIVADVMHGAGAGYLDRALAEHGIAALALRTGRDVLFDGRAPDPSEENLDALARAMRERGAHVGLATDGDADRFGILDAGGSFVAPNHILALLYDYLVESRGWRLGAARSVATSHLIDAVARQRGLPLYETPVGFKYIGRLIEEDKIALGGEESAGLSVRGHVPEKDGILAGLLVAEMVAARRATLAEQLDDLFRRVGVECWPLRVNLRLSAEERARLVERLSSDFPEFLGRRVAQADRTDGLKLVFEDGSWALLRLSGTEPLVRLYTEAASREAAKQLAEEAERWIRT